MKMYDMTLLFTAEKRLTVLANSEEEARDKVREIYLTTDVLDVYPATMHLHFPVVKEVGEVDYSDQCEGDCEHCLMGDLDLCDEGCLYPDED